MNANIAEIEESDDNWDLIDKRFTEIVRDLASQAMHPVKKLEILLSISIAHSSQGHMPIYVWKNCVQHMLAALDIFANRPKIVVDDTMEPDDSKLEKGADFKGTFGIWGNLVAFLEKLDVEFFKSLQMIDPHTPEYVERLRDEVYFLVLAQNVQEHLKLVGENMAAAKVALMRVLHVYYKSQEVYDAMRKLADQTEVG